MVFAMSSGGWEAGGGLMKVARRAVGCWITAPLWAWLLENNGVLGPGEKAVFGGTALETKHPRAGQSRSSTSISGPQWAMGPFPRTTAGSENGARFDVD